MWWNLPGISDGEDGEDEDVLPALADGNLGHEMEGEERVEGFNSTEGCGDVYPMKEPGIGILKGLV